MNIFAINHAFITLIIIVYFYYLVNNKKCDTSVLQN